MTKVQMRTPVKYYGGKTKMLPHILPLIPPHKIYVEAFAGGAAVYFAKKPSPVEVLNDINGNVANFYRALIQDFDGLLSEVECTLHCEHTYRQACEIYRNPDDVTSTKRAWAFWVCANMSYGGEVAGSFQWVRNKTDNWHPAIAIKKRREQFKHYRNRLATTSVRELMASDLIRKMDSSDVWNYLDPPYVGAKQGHYEGYKQEDFNRLIDTCADLKGKFLLSSYRNEYLSEMTSKNGWNTLEVNQRVGVSGGKGRKIEVLTWNYEVEANNQTINSLFD